MLNSCITRVTYKTCIIHILSTYVLFMCLTRVVFLNVKHVFDTCGYFSCQPIARIIFYVTILFFLKIQHLCPKMNNMNMQHYHFVLNVSIFVENVII